MDTGGPPGGPRDRRSRPTGGPISWIGRGPPGLFLSLRNSYKFQKVVSWSFRTFGVVQNRFPTFAPFPTRIPAANIPPLHDNLVK